MSSSGGSISSWVGGHAAAIVIAVVAAGAGVALVPTVTGSGGGGGGSCTGSDVTTGTFASRVSAAAAGDVLCLSAGNYGNWAGANKSSPGITVKPASGVAQSAVSLTPDFTTGTIRNITVQGVTTHDITIYSNAANVTLKDFHEAGASLLNLNGMSNQNIVLDGGDFDMTDCPDTPADCRGDATEGRLGITKLDGVHVANVGLSIINSRFHHSCADGIETGGQYFYGVTIGPGNEFDHLDLQCAGAGNPNGVHVDALAMGGDGTHIIGNYFHDNDDGIANYDATPSDVVVSNNVFAHIPISQPTSNCAAICVGAADNLTITHNTVMSDAFVIINVNHDGVSSTNITMRDNILDGPVGIQGSPTFTAQDHNLCLSGTCTGTGSLNGSPAPSWVGGATPTTLAGYVLAASSRGENAASDGTDIGYNAP